MSLKSVDTLLEVLTKLDFLPEIILSVENQSIYNAKKINEIKKNNSQLVVQSIHWSLN